MEILTLLAMLNITHDMVEIHGHGLIAYDNGNSICITQNDGFVTVGLYKLGGHAWYHHIYDTKNITEVQQDVWSLISPF